MSRTLAPGVDGGLALLLLVHLPNACGLPSALGGLGCVMTSRFVRRLSMHPRPTAALGLWCLPQAALTAYRIPYRDVASARPLSSTRPSAISGEGSPAPGMLHRGFLATGQKWADFHCF